MTRMRSLLIGFSLLLLVLGARMRWRSYSNRCEMTYMHPKLVEEEVWGNDTPYRLMRYVGDRVGSSEGAATLDMGKRYTHAVIFVPGHGGNALQVRSLGRHVRRLQLDAEVYVVDTREEPSGVHAGFLWQQARFLTEATRTVSGLHANSDSVVLLGHSLGGLVARTALVLPRFPVGLVRTIFTLGAPHQGLPFALDRSMPTFYTGLRRFWRTERPPIPSSSFEEAMKDKALELEKRKKTEEGAEGGAASGVWGYMKKLFGRGEANSSGTNGTNVLAGGSNNATVAMGRSDVADEDNDGVNNNATAAGTSRNAATTTKTCSEQAGSDGTCVAGDATSAVGVANDSDGGKQSHGEFPDEKEAPEGPKVEIPSARGSRREKARKLYAEASEARLARLRFANSRLGNVSLVSLGGGLKDLTVFPPSLVTLHGLVPPGQGMHVVDSGDFLGWRGGGEDYRLAAWGASESNSGMDHLALLWCYQLQDRLALALGRIFDLPDTTTPSERIQIIQRELFSGAPGTAEDGRASALKQAGSRSASSAIGAYCVNLADAFVESVADLALGLASHRVWLLLPVWTAVGSLALAAPLLHALLGVSFERYPSVLATRGSGGAFTAVPPATSLLGSPALHWPALVLAPGCRVLRKYCSSGDGRRYAHLALRLLGASVALYVVSVALSLAGYDGAQFATFAKMLADRIFGETAATTTTGAEGGSGGGGGDDGSDPPLDPTDNAAGSTPFLARAAAIFTWFFAAMGSFWITTGAALLRWLFSALAAPGGTALAVASATIATALPLLLTYGMLLPLLGGVAQLVSLIQRVAATVHDTVSASLPVRLVCRLGTGTLRTLGRVPLLGGLLGLSASASSGGDGGALSGDEQREEFRRRQRERHAPVGLGQQQEEKKKLSWVRVLTWGDGFLGLRGAEATLASVLAMVFLALHVESLPFSIVLPHSLNVWNGDGDAVASETDSRHAGGYLKLRGYLSLDRSFAHELAIWTLFGALASGALLLSYVLFPPRGLASAKVVAASRDHSLAARRAAVATAELGKYQLLLLVAYGPPLLPLTYGAVRHAISALARPASALTLVYSGASALAFDGLVDAALLLCVATHAFYARFRPMPLPRALDGVQGMFQLPETATSLASGSSGSEEGAMTTIGKATAADGGSVSEPGKATWRRIWQWRTGEAYYENLDTGELLYPDGGSRAVFEETSVDSVRIGDGVTVGPEFRVIVDRSDEFEEMWGHKFALSRSAKEVTKMEEVVERALEQPDAWLVMGIHAAVVFQIISSLSGAYHCLTAIGVLSGIFAWKHRQAGALPSQL